MKVVISGYVGKKITGIGRNLICLLDHSKSNNKYIVYTNEDMKDDLCFKNPNVIVKTYKISKNSSLWNLLWTTFVFPFIVLKEKAEKALIPNFTLLLLKFKPTMVIMHDLIEFNVPDKFSKKKMFYRTKLADPISAKRANHIITVSENSKKDIMKFLNIEAEKISVIYNGVDRKKFIALDNQVAAKIILNRNWPEKYLLYAGTIDHPGKNAMSVIQAFEKLKSNKEYDGSLILAGMPGAGYQFIEEYVEKSEVKEDIIITGFVTDEELVALYNKCDVFCFVSLYEGFGIPPLEALSCGANVITSNASSLPEVVGNVGLTINPTDVNALADAIMKIINKDWIVSREEIEAHLLNYDWNNLSKKFEEVLRQY